jgi:alkylated DNA repair protein (DNA oxidative demethylase)
MKTAPIEPEGFLYIPDFLSLNEQDSVLHEFRSLIYKHDVFRGLKLKRAYAQFGYSYVSNGRKLEVAPEIPAFLQTLIKNASPYYPSDITFTQCIVTRYPHGAGIGWHTDAPQFGNYVIGVSLTGEARLQFRLNSSKEVAYEVKVAPGSLYVMQGLLRWNYQHQVIPVKVERYSLTFRYLTERKN